MSAYPHPLESCSTHLSPSTSISEYLSSTQTRHCSVCLSSSTQTLHCVPIIIHSDRANLIVCTHHHPLGPFSVCLSSFTPILHCVHIIIHSDHVVCAYQHPIRSHCVYIIHPNLLLCVYRHSLRFCSGCL